MFLVKTLGKIKRKNYKKKRMEDKAVPANRIIIGTVFIILLFVCLIGRIAWIQFVSGSNLKELASRQQTLNKIISPKRGRIYDASGKPLAVSAPVDTITINPSKFIIKNKPEETAALQEKVAKGLSEIFNLDYETVYAQVKSTKSIETIIKKVETEYADKLVTWMKDNKVTSGINIDEDNKRYYPYDNLAAHVIGFTGAENTGLYGVEYEWNSILQGTSGKIVTTKDVNESEISGNADQYVEVENGSDIYLTIDVNIQMIVEKYLEQGVTDNGARAGSAIAMNPDTGDILAMATYPSYNLNSPSTITTMTEEEVEALTKEQRETKRQEMWSDRNFSSTYEPGSTFKLIVAATALEESITGVDIANDFNCNGYAEVEDRQIKCANSAVHGRQTLRQALGNSCNSAMIQLGQRIGATTLYKYLRAFGFFERTGVGIVGESRSNFHDLSKVGPVELATTSFGQRFEITPLQLITAVSAIANDGKLMKPRIVKQYINTDTKTITEIETTEVRKVISEDTAKQVRNIMKYVVTDGGGRYGKVEGYSIGGKTGTSEPSPSHPEDGYAVSFISLVPVEDPEIVILVVIYNPSTENPYGSKIAAPIVANMLSEILPYMGIASENSDTKGAVTTIAKTTKVPDMRNKTLTEAKKSLENLGFKVVNAESTKANSILVTEQVPASGTSVIDGSTIILYTEENSVRTSVTVPNLIGKPLSEAKSELAGRNLNINYSGSGKVVSQDIPEGTSIEQGMIITLKLE